MEDTFLTLLKQLGDDPHRPGLQDTPRRAAAALRHLTTGYHQDLASLVEGGLFPSDSRGMVVVRNIEVYSLCEHHLLPFFGKCHIGYLPNGKILGLSRISKIVEMYARRLQVQEQLTYEISKAIYDCTDAMGVAVIVEARHMCMMICNTEKHNAILTTSNLLGKFEQDTALYSEFMGLLRNRLCSEKSDTSDEN